MVNGNSEGVGIVNSLSLSRKVISEAENSRGGGGWKSTNQITILGEGTDIFWNHTIYSSVILRFASILNLLIPHATLN